ncbi:MAG: type VI secretion system baseplate subunit TssK [Acidobacteria bacterium]|nr:type VI secretion system baseplate subunit TssK [Acidobacteriota bacterium]
MRADDIPAAVHWYEGMLLAPQHFQLSAARQEMLVDYTTLLVSPYGWGLRRLKINPQLLSSGSFQVEELEAVMPDGTVVAAKPGELILDLTASLKSVGQGAVTVHLALPARTAAGVKGELPRLVNAGGEEVADENTADNRLPVARSRPNLSLVASQPKDRTSADGKATPESNAPDHRYVSFPLAKVLFKDEAYVLDDYVPPVVAVAPGTPGSPLNQMCGQLVSRLREKAMFVSEKVRSPSAILDKPLLAENRSKMHSLVAGLPQFEALLATGTSHPLPLYLALCTLAGHLASLGTSLLPPVAAPYNHLDLRASFQEMLDFALKMTNEGVPETHQVFPFRLRDGVFELLFETAWANRRLVLGLRQASGVTERELITWGEECVIGSAGVTTSLLSRRILGAKREFVESDDTLVPARGVKLFTLTMDPEIIRPGELLQVLNNEERGRSWRPLEMVLYVKHAS